MGQDDRNGIYEKWSVSRFILKCELIKLADGVDVRYKEKRENFYRVSGNHPSIKPLTDIAKIRGGTGLGGKVKSDVK